MWNGVSVKTAPTLLPVSITELKERLLIDSDEQDAVLLGMLKSAISMVDGPDGIGYAMMQQTWQKSMDVFPTVILLPGAPVKSVTSISYVDEAGATQVLDSADYRIDVSSEPARITPAYGKVWPTIRHVIGAITVEYVLGEGSADNVLPALVTAVSMIAGTYYSNRDALSEGKNSVVPFGAAGILANHTRLLMVA